MNYGIKVSKQGFSVLNEDARELNKESKSNKTLPHLLYALALPYLLGANAQVKRYKNEASKLKVSPVASVYGCLHELSTLLEDLCTVSKYVEMCGEVHDLHSLWFDLRNHVRHDIREEYDNDTDSRKISRSKRLQLDPKLQTSIGFDVNAFKIGKQKIHLSEVGAYLEWADLIIADTLRSAEEKGYIE